MWGWNRKDKPLEIFTLEIVVNDLCLDAWRIYIESKMGNIYCQVNNTKMKSGKKSKSGEKRLWQTSYFNRMSDHSLDMIGFGASKMIKMVTRMANREVSNLVAWCENPANAKAIPSGRASHDDRLVWKTSPLFCMASFLSSAGSQTAEDLMRETKECVFQSIMSKLSWRR